MTAKYPNKEHVAYATFLSSNPREKVGGVEIDSKDQWLNDHDSVAYSRSNQEAWEFIEIG
uniref:Uncharacterized protein n=2 Tax=Oryza TaxID=4527 RepID=A0A0D3GIR2_9ORYZ